VNAAWDVLGYTGSTDEDAGEADEQRNHTKEYFQMDFGSSGNAVQFCGLIGPISEVFSVSSDATITLKGTNILDFDTPEFSRSITHFDSGLYEFLDDAADTNYRYWRLEIVDRLNTSGPEGFIFSYLYLGTYLTIENRNVNSGFVKDWIDETTVQVSESGTEYFKIRPKYLAFRNSSMNFLDASDRRNIEQFFYDVGIYTPFFVAFDPLQNCTEDITELTKYVRFNGEPSFNHFRSNIYNVSFAVREAL
jgi:hypothetical protein